MNITATTSLEIELSLSATYSPARPATGPSYASGGDPPEDASVDDVTVTGLGIVTAVSPPFRELGSHRTIWKTTSALDGVNINSPDIQRLFQNLLALTGDDAERALVEAGAE